jgi:hypothetical protein
MLKGDTAARTELSIPRKVPFYTWKTPDVSVPYTSKLTFLHDCGFAIGDDPTSDVYAHS